MVERLKNLNAKMLGASPKPRNTPNMRKEKISFVSFAYFACFAVDQLLRLPAVTICQFIWRWGQKMLNFFCYKTVSGRRLGVKTPAGSGVKM
jgi:hypothetical protein